jgi:hypothetical protein
LILLTKYHHGAEIMKVVVYKRGKVHTKSGWGNLGERDNWEGLGVDGKIILEWSSRDRFERRGPDCSGSG